MFRLTQGSFSFLSLHTLLSPPVVSSPTSPLASLLYIVSRTAWGQPRVRELLSKDDRKNPKPSKESRKEKGKKNDFVRGCSSREKEIEGLFMRL